jgi:DNA adenine methylase
MKPPISYYGGKQRMASKIIPLIPKHTVYVEPFAGGAAVLFKKPWPDVSNNNHYREVINDIDSRLINFYRVLRDPVLGNTLYAMLKLTGHSREEHQTARCHEYGSDTLKDAWAYYVNVTQSFGHELNAGWRTSKQACNESATWESKTGKLFAYTDRMRSIHIEHDDALNVIKRWDSPHTFFYCDPPYPGTDCGHYKGYTIKDFEKLIATLNRCKGSFLLSNYDQDVTFPDDWTRHTFDTSMYVARDKTVDKKRTEIVWKRGNTTPVRKEIQDLFDSGKFDCFKG